MEIKRALVFTFLLSGLTACQTTTLTYMKNVKLVSFTGEAVKAKSVGPVYGESCSSSGLSSMIAGSQEGSPDKALISLRQGTTEGSVAGILGNQNKGNTVDISYVNNVSLSYKEKDGGLVNGVQKCYVAKGLGYK